MLLDEGPPRRATVEVDNSDFGTDGNVNPISSGMETNADNPLPQGKMDPLLGRADIEQSKQRVIGPARRENPAVRAEIDGLLKAVGGRCFENGSRPAQVPNLQGNRNVGAPRVCQVSPVGADP
jgi:hypothetical protein